MSYRGRPTLRFGRLLIAIPICLLASVAVFVAMIAAGMGDCEVNGEVVGCDRGLLGLLMFPGSLLAFAVIIFLLARWVTRKGEAAE
jgi:hypothetical protein